MTYLRYAPRPPLPLARYAAARCLDKCNEWLVIDVDSHALTAARMTKEQAEVVAVAANDHECLPSGRRVLCTDCSTPLAGFREDAGAAPPDRLPQTWREYLALAIGGVCVAVFMYLAVVGLFTVAATT